MRVDSHLYDGYAIPPNYDSMIGKLICHGENREQAIARMRVALHELGRGQSGQRWLRVGRCGHLEW